MRADEKHFTAVSTHNYRDTHGRVVFVVAMMGTLGVVPWRVCASHYREWLPVSAFLYLYPRLNSYGTTNNMGKPTFHRPAENCIPLARSLARVAKTIHTNAALCNPSHVDSIGSQKMLFCIKPWSSRAGYDGENTPMRKNSFFIHFLILKPQEVLRKNCQTRESLLYFLWFMIFDVLFCGIYCFIEFYMD